MKNLNHTFDLKNKLYLAVLALALVAVFVAPSHADGLILRGGMNFANAETDPEIDEDNQEFRPGFNAAVLGEVGDGPLRLLLGAGYENRGLRIKGGGNSGDVRLNYVTVPVMLQLGTAGGTSPMPRVFVNLGVEPAFLVQSDVALDNFTFDIDAEEFDFGLRGEAGIEIPISPTAGIVLGAGYSQSVTDAAKDDDTEWYNRAFHLFAGVKLGMF